MTKTTKCSRTDTSGTRKWFVVYVSTVLYSKTILRTYMYIYNSMHAITYK